MNVLHQVSNQDFADYVNATNYVTENERFGWSFVFEKLLPEEVLARVSKAVAGAGDTVRVHS